MINYLRTRKLHLLVWLLAAAYLAAAPQVRAQVFIQDGKPVRADAPLPSNLHQGVEFWIDSAEIYDERGVVYDVRGWAFVNRPDAGRPQEYRRSLALISGERNYIFDLRDQQRLAVQQAFPDLAFDVRQSGFSALVFRDAIQAGRYCIGLIFTREPDGESFLVNTRRVLERTPNFLILDPTQKDRVCRWGDQGD